MTERLHATCVVLNGKGVLITGPSGSGKSDLALRLIDSGAKLVADDQVVLARKGKKLVAEAPPILAGLIEARHMGIIRSARVKTAIVALILEPGASGSIDRLPEDMTINLLGVGVPVLRLPYFEASAPAKVRLWLKQKEKPGV